MPEQHTKSNQYSVVVKAQNRRGAHKLWCWEIRGVPELGVKRYGEGFRSNSAAKLAGEKALRGFLKALSEEERNA
jgi:hypothetical protein